MVFEFFGIIFTTSLGIGSTPEVPLLGSLFLYLQASKSWLWGALGWGVGKSHNIPSDITSIWPKVVSSLERGSAVRC